MTALLIVLSLLSPSAHDHPATRLKRMEPHAGIMGLH
jgi:hypothetical protein